MTTVDAAWVALSLVEQIGSVRLRALLEVFGTPAAVIAADEADLRRVHGIGQRTAAAIHALDVAAVEAQLQAWSAREIRVLPLDDPLYPERLRALRDAPPCLFVRGHWTAETCNKPGAAIVGTRTPSPAARAAAHHIAGTLGAGGCTLISGLARGIDAIVHLEALSAANPHTWAVLGSGLDRHRWYPPEHRDLAERVLSCGALLSEQPPDAESKPAHLVARNRIISGLSSALIIIETAVDGGAMYAARRALEQGRPVYTLDLPASGNQALLTEGASLLDLTTFRCT